MEPSFKIKSKIPTTYPDPPKYELKNNNTIPTSSSSSLSQSFLEFQNEKIYHNFKEILEVPERIVVVALLLPPPPIKIHLDYLNCLLVNLLLSIDLKLLNQF